MRKSFHILDVSGNTLRQISPGHAGGWHHLLDFPPSARATKNLRVSGSPPPSTTRSTRRNWPPPSPQRGPRPRPWVALRRQRCGRDHFFSGCSCWPC
jgi:hypothetical protein